MFNWLFNLGNTYAKESTWKDFAALKLCLFSLGMGIGVWIGESAKMAVFWICLAVFILTYIPLMIKLFKVTKSGKAK
ncbi:MAG: hypothetical protein Q8882_04345 [Bacillota bacterium]|nr:hypothetical protein [Bacillota bacterium]